MSTKLKLYLGRKILETLKKPSSHTSSEILQYIRVGKITHPQTLQLAIPIEILERNLGITNIQELLKIQPDDIIKKVSYTNNRANRVLSFEIDRNIFIKEVIESSFVPDLNFKPKSIVVEYSSPNIAKPFHLGHLRSTIIGNFISNINSFLQNKVTRINYLGDWGTQFGFIKIGVDQLKYTRDDIKKSPLKILYESYVYANKLAEKDPTVLEQAKLEFSKLESNTPDYLESWRQFMSYTKEELKNTYNRLGVTFDDYNYESDYSAKNIEKLIEFLRNKKIISKDPNGKQVAEINDRKVTVIKSDGSTLYLTRDIAAAVERYNKYKFDKMYYVVDNSQNDHFNALKVILHRMDLPWATRLHHVKFGRIHGMSSRKGKGVFLQDILDECKELMIQRQIESPTTKISVKDSETSDVLGVSCVIVNDLKQRRQKDYEFTWDKVLQLKGDTGIKLQYTHSRLHSLEENSGAIRPKECNPDLLKEPEVTDLILALAEFPDTIARSEELLEAYVLVNYLFHLCNATNKALKVLKLKGSDPELAAQRLLLFITARNVLREGMVILGLKPLNKM